MLSSEIAHSSNSLSVLSGSTTNNSTEPTQSLPNSEPFNSQVTPELAQNSSATPLIREQQEEGGNSNPKSLSNHKGGRKQIQYFHDHRPFKINTTDKKDKNMKYMVYRGKDPQERPCKAKAKLDLTKNEWNTARTFHVCKPDRGIEQVPAFEAYLKRLLHQDREADIERCYTLAQIDYPDAAKIYPYNDSLARKLRAWRSEGDTIPTEPIKNTQQLAEYLQKNPEVLQYVLNYEENPKKRQLKFEGIKVETRRHLIIYDPKLAHRMRDATT
ncbi:hypothetical protein QAD02_003100 [Eretmocerus hayati]|uniref:Uncharacterized protein n=1 Tax=Eretmocerus hayati TaxID=131215 RepID=A0ACC2NL57_9HYME|nr:hypothetical protein QAD02_003100 [Eretmocerus hayati]